MRHYARHIGDWIAATAHLSDVEECIYSRLLDQYYAREAPLPPEVEQCQRLARASSKEARKAVAAMLDEFFTLQDDGWHQKRADAEIEKYREKAAKASESAAARWSNGNANAMRTHSERNANASKTHSVGNANHEPRTKNQEPTVKSVAASPKRPRQQLDAPTPDHEALATSLGVPCETEFQKFRDWLAANGRRQSDEAAGFRNWLRRAAEYRQPARASPNGRETAKERALRNMDEITGNANGRRTIEGVAERVDSPGVLPDAGHLRIAT